MDTPVPVLVTAEDVAGQIAELMEQAAAGHVVTIAVDGQPVAQLAAGVPRVDRTALFEEMAALRQRLRDEGVKPFSPEELVSLVREGRRF